MKVPAETSSGIGTKRCMEPKSWTTKSFAATSDPTDWYEPDATEKKDKTTYETQVILHRKGDFVFPVEAEVKFDNGDSTRERWDGKAPMGPLRLSPESEGGFR